MTCAQNFLNAVANLNRCCKCSLTFKAYNEKVSYFCCIILSIHKGL